MVIRLVSFVVAPIRSREATAACSLGRNPFAVAASRLWVPFFRFPWAHAQGYMLSPLRGCNSATSKSVSEDSGIRHMLPR
jgi:hypothetical protein